APALPHPLLRRGDQPTGRAGYRLGGGWGWLGAGDQFGPDRGDPGVGDRRVAEQDLPQPDQADRADTARWPAQPVLAVESVQVQPQTPRTRTHLPERRLDPLKRSLAAGWHR